MATIALENLAPAAVRVPLEEEEGARGADVDVMSQLKTLLASAQLGASPDNTQKPARRGVVSATEIAEPKASAKAVGAEDEPEGEISQLLGDAASLSEFTGLMKASGVLAELDAAAKMGEAVSVFAPSNDALVKLPNLGFVKMKRSPESADMRDSFVRQHVVKDMDQQSAFASAQYSLDNVGTAIESMQGGAHVSIQGHDDGPMAGAHLAAMHDDAGAPLAAARILRSTTVLPQGHSIHVLSAALTPSE